MSPLLEVRGLTKRYGGLTANANVVFDVNEGEIVGIIGPNGAGKSTLFDLITGFQPPDAGRVLLDGHDITGLRPDRISHLGVARTFQKLKPFLDLTVTENVIVGALAHTSDLKTARDRALESLAFVNLLEKRNDFARELSTGQRKRLELARGLATGPRLILMDEVTGGVDQRSIAGLITLVLELTCAWLIESWRCTRGDPSLLVRRSRCAASPLLSTSTSGRSTMLLDVRDLEVAYGDYQVIWGVSLSVAAGESVALLGPNGSGKSTVVNTISGLLAAKAGEIRLDGASLKTRPTHVRASLGIAHVLERRRVFPHLTVLQNLTLGAWHSAAKAARARTLERVFTLFPRLSECKSQLARTLSGGEQQMLALGRGLMALPRLLMVDEPFLGLAPRVVEQMKSVFQALQAEGIAILFIEQNVRLALSMAGRGYILESGRLAIEGAAPTLINSPEVRRIFLGG